MRAPTLAIVVAAALGALPACKAPFALYCDEQTACTDPDRPYCDLTGAYGDGHGNICVPSPFDASLPLDSTHGTPDGGSDADTTVPPSAPVLLAPPNGAFTGSVFSDRALEPVLRWLPAANATSYEVEIESDCPVVDFASCAFGSPDVQEPGIEGERFQPAEPLDVETTAPVGRRYFWRVRACNQSGCSDWSAVRYLNVGRQATDYNGDGYADRLVTSPSGVHMYFGKADWTIPSTVESEDVLVTDPVSDATGQFGYSLTSAGDVNADGFADFVVGAPTQERSSQDEGVAYLYLGRASWTNPVSAADSVINNPISQQSGFLGGAGCGGGDVDGDGYGDFVLTATGHSTPETEEGNAFLYLGKPVWPPRTNVADVTIDNPFDRANTGNWVPDCHGDLNGDGLADLAIGYPDMANPEEDEGSAVVYFGRHSWGVLPATVEASDVRIDNPDDEVQGHFGFSVACNGDIDDDGYADLVVGAYLQSNPELGEGNVFLYLGSSTWEAILESAYVRIDDPGAVEDGRFGSMVSTAGDVDGDGIVDLLVAARRYTNPETEEGNLFLYAGRSNWPSEVLIPDVDFDNPLDEHQTMLGISATTHGDMNGDGFSDIAAGASRASNPEANEGTVFIWFGQGSLAATVESADIALDNPSDSGTGFGAIME